MNNKGFTLIELLAVIVILAIIALIATPIVLGIINDARTQAQARTTELIRDEVKLAYTSYMFKNPYRIPDSACEFINDDFFAMDGAKIGNCNNNVVTIMVDSNVYTVAFDGESATITSPEAGASPVITQLTKVATSPASPASPTS